jgi:hypothetical protein
MTLLRIVTNIATDSVPDVRKFYSDLFGLDAVMDHGWLVTLASRETTILQISIASEGGSGTPVPDLSIEVDNVDEVYLQRALASSLEIVCNAGHWRSYESPVITAGRVGPPRIKIRR